MLLLLRLPVVALLPAGLMGPTRPLVCHGSILMAAAMCPALLHQKVLLLLSLWLVRHTKCAQLPAYRVGGSTDETIHQKVQLRIAATRDWPRPTVMLMLLLL